MVERAPSKGAAPPAPQLNKQPSKKKKAPAQPSAREVRKREEDERRQRILEELQRKKETEEKRREEKKRILENNARRKEEKRNQEQQQRENKRSSMLEDIKKRKREMKEKKSEFDVQIYGLGGSQKIEEEKDNSSKAANEKQPLEGFAACQIYMPARPAPLPRLTEEEEKASPPGEALVEASPEEKQKIDLIDAAYLRYVDHLNKCLEEEENEEGTQVWAGEGGSPELFGQEEYLEEGKRIMEAAAMRIEDEEDREDEIEESRGPGEEEEEEKERQGAAGAGGLDL